MSAVSIKAPNWLHRHLLGPKGANIKQIHEAYPAVHVNFEDNDKISIEGPVDGVKQVQATLEKSVADLVLYFS